jgi:hypothetical protein
MHCFPLNNTEYDASALGAWFATRERGVLSADGNLAVTADGSGMSVTLQPGYAWLKRDTYWGTAVWTDNPTTFILDEADGVLPRIDVIVLQLDKDENAAQLLLRKGAFSNSPVFTAPVRDAHADEIYVASVFVGPGAVKISQADVTDLRMDESVCGVMRDGITGIPTAQLQAQVQQLIDHLRAEVDGIEQGSEVMLKTVYDADGDGVVDEAAAAPWDGITGKPETYSPSTHNHDDRYYTESEMNTKLSGKANSSHTHTKDQVGLSKVNNNAIGMGYDGNLWISFS